MKRYNVELSGILTGEKKVENSALGGKIEYSPCNKCGESHCVCMTAQSICDYADDELQDEIRRRKISAVEYFDDSVICAMRRTLLAENPVYFAGYEFVYGVMERAMLEVDDLAALVAQLAHSLRQAAPDNELATMAVDYLQRKRLIGAPLR